MSNDESLLKVTNLLGKAVARLGTAPGLLKILAEWTRVEDTEETAEKLSLWFEYERVRQEYEQSLHLRVQQEDERAHQKNVEAGGDSRRIGYDHLLLRFRRTYSTGILETKIACWSAAADGLPKDRVNHAAESYPVEPGYTRSSIDVRMDPTLAPANSVWVATIIDRLLPVKRRQVA